MKSRSRAAARLARRQLALLDALAVQEAELATGMLHSVNVERPPWRTMSA